MRYAGFLLDGEPADMQADEPLHRLLSEIGRLSNEQLIVLIDQAWEEYRGRAGFNLEASRRYPRKQADS